VRLESVPSGVPFVVVGPDGRKGRTPVVLAVPPGGELKVRLGADGYYSQTVVLKHDSPERRVVKLRPIVIEIP
jgi:hypothetical protein